MYKHILLPVEPADEGTWRKALPTSLELARAFGAELHLVTVVPEIPSGMIASYLPEDWETKSIEHGKERLEAFAAEHVPKGTPLQLIVAHGRIYAEICRLAEEVGADLIVMASHRRELRDVLMAPNADQVLHHTEIPVLIVRN